MAGGKETPRQKMIGMMYLVLTALLALNVSKSILDAFVAIEENIQKANLTELYRGDEKKAELAETAVDNSNPGRAAKAKLLLDGAVEKIDVAAKKRIDMIDKLKLKILEACKEDITSKGKEESIITSDDKKNPLKPVRMNLMNVSGKDKYDEPMQVMGVAKNIKQPEGDGLALWNSYLDFRKEITEIIAATQVTSDPSDTTGMKVSFDTRYKFTAPKINKFKDNKELNDLVRKSMTDVHPDDKEAILDIYTSLTKEEFSKVHDVDGVHWIGKTFDHSPSVAALASLSSMQKDILAARATAIALVRGRVGGGEYSFNKIIPLAYGPSVVNSGEEFEVRVMMAAYDSDKQPEVVFNGQPLPSASVREGQGFVKTSMGSSGELKGTVSIRNKSGIKKTLDWTHTVVVMEPSGSIELPELNVLYRGYDNKVRVSASGYPESSLSATNASVSPATVDGAKGYIVRPGGGATSIMSVIGKDVNGQSFPLKKLEFRVERLPDPALFWGRGNGTGGSTTNSPVLLAEYGPGIPLKATFSIVSWEMPAKGGVLRGSGNNIAQVMAFVSTLSRGEGIGFNVKVRKPDNTVTTIGGVWTKP